MATEKVMEWVFKIATALVIPTIVWTLRISSEVAVLKSQIAAQEKSISSISELKGELHEAKTKVAVNSETIKGVSTQVVRISNTLDRIENHFRSRRP